MKLGTSDILLGAEDFRSYRYDLPDDDRLGELGEMLLFDMTERTERDRARLRKELDLGDTVGGPRELVGGLGGRENA